MSFVLGLKVGITVRKTKEKRKTLTGTANDLVFRDGESYNLREKSWLCSEKWADAKNILGTI
jgi:hypothetical protein